MRSFLFTLLLLVGVSAGGLLATKATLTDGLAAYNGDPATEAVGRRALDAVQEMNASPAARILLPRIRVESVEREPGHCPADEPGARDSLADYVARVRTYTWYRIPVGTVEAWCGGLVYGGERPAASAGVAGSAPPPAERPLPAVQIASARVDLDTDGLPEDIELLADVELGPDDEPIWEDGHWWAVVVRDSVETHRLVHEFVAMGRLTAWIVQPDQERPIVVVQRESGTAGLEVQGFRHDGAGRYADTGHLDATGRPLARLEGERRGAGPE